MVAELKPDEMPAEPSPDGQGDVEENGQAGATRVYVATRMIPRHAEPRASRVYLERVGPLSVLRLTLIFSALTVAAVIAGLFILYQVLAATGVLADVEKLVNTSGLGNNFHFAELQVFRPIILGGFAFVAFLSLLAAFVAVLYNAVSDLVGGLDVTFVERRAIPGRAPSRLRSIRMTRSNGPATEEGQERAEAGDDTAPMKRAAGL